MAQPEKEREKRSGDGQSRIRGMEKTTDEGATVSKRKQNKDGEEMSPQIGKQRGLKYPHGPGCEGDAVTGKKEHRCSWSVCRKKKERTKDR